MQKRPIDFSIFSLLDAVFFVIPGCLLVLDLVFFGSGLWSSAIGISLRKLCFAIVCCYSFLKWIFSGRVKVAEISAVFFLCNFFLVWAIFLPLFFFGDLEFALSDAQLFFGLIFAPAIYSTLGPCRWSMYRKWIFIFTSVLAVLHLLIVLYNFLSPDDMLGFVVKIRSFLEPLNEEGDSSVLIGYVENSFRVFWGSSIFLLVALYFAIRNFDFDRLSKSAFVLLLVVAAIFSTLTRGLLLSIPIFVLAVVFFRFLFKHFYLGGALVFLYGLILAAITVPVMFLSDPTLLSLIGIGRDVSDDIRSDQVSILFQSILNAPFLGHGFGYFLDQVRSETAPWSYEMSIMALYMKIGLLGVLVLLLTFVMFFYTYDSSISKEKISNDLSWVAAFGVIVTFCSNTNPYLFSMLGVGLVLFLYFEFRYAFTSFKSERISC